VRAIRVASAGAIGVGIVIAAACDFPDPLLFDVDMADAGGSSDSSISADGGGNDVPPDAADDVANDAMPDANDCASECDCDGDGVLALECDGSDCDDHDPLRFPDAGFSPRIPAPGQSGDWNCDGIEEKNAPTGVKCAGTPVGQCASGFADSPACGTSATFVVCEVSGAPEQCMEAARQTRTVECR